MPEIFNIDIAKTLMGKIVASLHCKIKIAKCKNQNYNLRDLAFCILL